MAVIQSIIIRPQKKGLPERKSHVQVTALGIEGDHYAKADGLRQVTLIAADALAEVAATVGFQGDTHIACRRNIMVDHLPSENLKGKIITLGKEVVLEITGYCQPCFRMEENFGEGAINAFSEKAGWIAKVLKEGKISVGDKILMT